MNGENTNYQHNLAMVLYYGFENHESSEKYFRKSLKSCGSSHPDIIRHYNVLLIKQKRWEESHAYYEILFKIIDKYKAQREQQLKEEIIGILAMDTVAITSILQPINLQIHRVTLPLRNRLKYSGM